MIFSRAFRINAAPTAVQQILPKGQNQRFEGVAFSPDGKILGAATADTNQVHLFRRQSDGKFEDASYTTINKLNYPHDLAFAKVDDRQLLAVAERGGAISIYEERAGTFGQDASFVITGPDARLSHTDGVAFVPPYNDCLAACNLVSNTISFYARNSTDPVKFEIAPNFELTHPSIVSPDGLGFSANGRFLAIANHGAHSISVFERKGPPIRRTAPTYGPEPFAIIGDPDLRYTHSVAFSDGGHLIATNAGANYFSVYKMHGWLWQAIKPQRVLRQAVADENVFREVNVPNKMEGGPKGLAIHGSTLAVCSPEIGIKIFSFRG
jgi:DNA-binding beta-propeller fold protein YncE